MCDRTTPQNIKSTWLSITQFLHRCSVSRLTPRLLTATRDSLRFDHGSSISERLDPLVLWYAEVDAVELFRTQKPIDFPTLIEANIRVGVGSNINQQDAASSSIDLALDMDGLMPKSDWLVALGKWDEALIATAREAEHGETDLFTNVANQVRASSLYRRIVCLLHTIVRQSAISLA
ncbi:hypothetical protein QFC22_004267 [Naganishia vaughanmartiniae]|uniref:Uncharacterized protein n=1 Tax=Naganishia vaughanmartiniae TaxID=1424756 RepID=A0ACC2X4K7_9TREE|nr:hypothetical protein QFC22_004267 [Naganishia vaughanmartiniae]